MNTFAFLYHPYGAPGMVLDLIPQRLKRWANQLAAASVSSAWQWNQRGQPISFMRLP